MMLMMMIMMMIEDLCAKSKNLIALNNRGFSEVAVILARI